MHRFYHGWYISPWSQTTALFENIMSFIVNTGWWGVLNIPLRVLHGQAQYTSSHIDLPRYVAMGSSCSAWTRCFVILKHCLCDIIEWFYLFSDLHKLILCPSISLWSGKDVTNKIIVGSVNFYNTCYFISTKNIIQYWKGNILPKHFLLVFSLSASHENLFYVKYGMVATYISLCETYIALSECLHLCLSRNVIEGRHYWLPYVFECFKRTTPQLKHVPCSFFTLQHEHCAIIQFSVYYNLANEMMKHKKLRVYRCLLTFLFISESLSNGSMVIIDLFLNHYINLCLSMCLRSVCDLFNRFIACTAVLPLRNIFPLISS